MTGPERGETRLMLPCGHEIWTRTGPPLLALPLALQEHEASCVSRGDLRADPVPSLPLLVRELAPVAGRGFGAWLR